MKWKKFFNSISGCIVKFGVEVSMQFKVLNEALKLYVKHKFIILKHLRSFITSGNKISMTFLMLFTFILLKYYCEGFSADLTNLKRKIELFDYLVSQITSIWIIFSQILQFVTPLVQGQLTHYTAQFVLAFQGNTESSYKVKLGAILFSYGELISFSQNLIWF